MAKSLRGQLLAWVLVPLAFTAAIDAWLTYESAVSTASVVQDRLLLGAARMIAEQIRFEDGAFQGPIPPAALELFQSEGLDRIYYRVSSGDGKMLSGYSDLPTLQDGSALASPTFSNTLMRGRIVRVVAVPQPVIGSPGTKPALVQVAQTRNEYQRLVNSLWKRELGRHTVILFITAAFIVLGTHLGTRGLLKLRDAIEGRHEGSLERLSMKDVPLEVLPLVRALNAYVERINKGINQRNSQLQNVAHQLRTPLTVLATHISDAIRAETGEQSSAALLHARRTLSQTNSVVHQFLQLSAAESFVVRSQPVDIEEFSGVLKDVLESMALFAHQKEIDLGLEVDPCELVIHTDLLAVREIARNLVDNAIRYTPKGGVVTLYLNCKPSAIELKVEDTGPGVPHSERRNIFERFVRLDSAQSDGSGLGLAIVRELAAQCDAEIRIEEVGHGGSGFGIVVSFR